MGSVLTRARVNVSPGWSAHITMDAMLVPGNKHIQAYRAFAFFPPSLSTALYFYSKRDLVFCSDHLLPNSKNYRVILTFAEMTFGTLTQEETPSEELQK